MTIRYRTDDPARWGTGIGVNLVPAQVDENFWDVVVRLAAIEALPPAAAGIDHFEIDGDQMLVVMTDGTTLGPYTLPVMVPQWKGEWQPNTPYLQGDMFNVGSTLYFVSVSHTSAASFDPGATDGQGRDLYAVMFSITAGMLPAGGVAGMILAKTSATDYAVAWVTAPVPAGGATGQVLGKLSDVDYDTGWRDHTLANLSDATVVAPADGEVLIYAGTPGWSNEALTLDLINDVAAEDAQDGQLLRFQSTLQKWMAVYETPVLTIATDTLLLNEIHIGQYLRCSHVSGCAITVPDDASWPLGVLGTSSGHEIHFRQGTSGGLTFAAGAGVTINGIDGFLLSTDRTGAVVTLKRVDANTWDLFGLLAEEASA